MNQRFPRRSFLQLLAASAGARLLPGCSSGPNSALGSSSSLSDPSRRADGSAKNVVVLGGGLAGLCSAYELQQRGYTIVAILEAQARTGGRVLTLRDGFQQGQYAEAGATRIADSHNYTMHYAFDLFDLPKVQYSTTDPAVYAVKGQRFVHTDGQPWPSLFDLSSAEQSLSATALIHRYEDLKDIGDPRAASWPTGSALQYDDYTFVDYLAQAGAEGLYANDDVVLIDRANNGASVVNEGALYTLMSDVVDAKWKNTYAIKGGNDQLPAAFTARLGSLIQTQCVVQAIQQDDSGVTISYQAADGTVRTVQGDIAVCALPFPPLRNVDLSGAGLSAAKLDVIANLPMQPVARCNLQLSSRFWNDQGITGLKVARTDLPIERMWDLSSVQDGDAGLLVAYMQDGSSFTSLLAPGDPGYGVVSDPTMSAVDFVLQNGETCFPGMRDAFLGASYKVWTLDPWCGGGWAAYGKGDMTSRFPAAKTREGRIYFAGEHTSCWSGWMQGALESANRVVAEITAG